MISVAKEPRVPEVLEPVARDGVVLALHAWVPTRPRAAVFFVHGIQSHGGWLFEMGPLLASMGVALYALDRRGSGYSGGERGDLPSLALLLDDYVAGFSAVRTRHRDVPLTLAGQSLGGAIVAGMIVDGRVEYDALAFCAPALGQMQRKNSPEQREAIRRDRSLAREVIGLREQDYTSDPDFLQFMNCDPRMLRTLTARARAALLELEELYLQREPAIGTRPAAFARPRQDAIIHLDVAQRTFATLTRGEGIEVQFPCDEHYLDFSRCRAAFRGWLASYALTGGYAA